MQQTDIQTEKERLIQKNYWSIYQELLPSEGPEIPCKQPFYIDNKHVYALSDIEGYNIDFLEMLRQAGLVEYYVGKKPTNEKCIKQTTCKDFNKWRQCSSYKIRSDGKTYLFNNVYYKFNEKACGKFNDVIVLCGDYVRNERCVSEGTVRILEELRYLLNVGKGTEEKKGLFLLAGNHDICNYSENEWSMLDLKKRVLDLGLYPQLLLVNGDGKKLLFQHTNFPYIEGNDIVNKKIDPKRGEKYLKNSKLYNLGRDSFFEVRYTSDLQKKSAHFSTMGNMYKREGELLENDIYSDHGNGYNAKFIGHDEHCSGAVKESGGGMIYNVHVLGGNRYNHGKKNYFKYLCVNKLKAEKKLYGFKEYFLSLYNEYNKKNPNNYKANFDLAFTSTFNQYFNDYLTC